MSTFLLLLLSSLLTRWIWVFWIESCLVLGFLPGFVMLIFEHHAHVRLRFKLASGFGQSWTRDGGIPQGCPLSMMFIVALYLPWCRYLAAHEGVQPQLYADILKCVSRDPGLLLNAARFHYGLCSVSWSGACSQQMCPFKYFQGGSEGYETVGSFPRGGSVVC